MLAEPGDGAFVVGVLRACLSFFFCHGRDAVSRLQAQQRCPVGPGLLLASLVPLTGVTGHVYECVCFSADLSALLARSASSPALPHLMGLDASSFPRYISSSDAVDHTARWRRRMQPAPEALMLFSVFYRGVFSCSFIENCAASRACYQYPSAGVRLLMIKVCPSSRSRSYHCPTRRYCPGRWHDAECCNLDAAIAVGY